MQRSYKYGSTLIGDIDNSLVYTTDKMSLKRITYKSNIEESYEALEPINRLCARFNF